MLDADLTNAGRQSVAGGRPLQLIVQTAFPVDQPSSYGSTHYQS